MRGRPTRATPGASRRTIRSPVKAVRARRLEKSRSFSVRRSAKARIRPYNTRYAISCGTKHTAKVTTPTLARAIIFFGRPLSVASERDKKIQSRPEGDEQILLAHHPHQRRERAERSDARATTSRAGRSAIRRQRQRRRMRNRRAKNLERRTCRREAACRATRPEPPGGSRQQLFGPRSRTTAEPRNRRSPIRTQSQRYTVWRTRRPRPAIRMRARL